MASKFGLLAALALSACEPKNEASQHAPVHQEVSAVSSDVKTSIQVVAETETGKLSPEQQEVVALLETLDAKLKSKYADSGWRSDGKKTYITSPIGNRLAVSVQGGGKVVSVNPDDHFRSSSTPEGILQVHPASMLREIGSDQYEETRSIRKANASREKTSLLWQRSDEYDNEIDFVYAEDGHAYGDVDLKAVFAAFGLPADMPATEKARIILTTLNEQL